MTGLWLALLILAITLPLDVLVVRALMRGSIGPLESRYPAREPAVDGVTRSFESIRLGIVNMGGSVHLTVDEWGLHIRPARMLRWFGVRGASVPWEAMRVRRRSGRTTSVKIDGVGELRGPSWALEMVEE